MDAWQWVSLVTLFVVVISVICGEGIHTHGWLAGWALHKKFSDPYIEKLERELVALRSKEGK